MSSNNLLVFETSRGSYVDISIAPEKTENRDIAWYLSWQNKGDHGDTADIA